MIDIATGERVVVSHDEKYGPCIFLESYQDAGALEDALSDDYHVQFWFSHPVEPNAKYKFFFGVAADSVKLQTLLDEIEFNWSEETLSKVRKMQALCDEHVSTGIVGLPPEFPF